MKNIFILLLAITCFSCNNTQSNASSPDSMNAIEDHPLQDTNVGSHPDGYAPPNTKMDTSMERKDSIQQSKQK